MAFSKNASCYTLLPSLVISGLLSLSALPVYATEPSPTTELEELRQRIDDFEDLVIDMESRGMAVPLPIALTLSAYI